MERGEFGAERYEKEDFQRTVAQNFEKVRVAVGVGVGVAVEVAIRVGVRAIRKGGLPANSRTKL